MKNQQSSHHCFNNQLRRRCRTKTNRWAKNCSVSNPLYFIFIFFYNPGPLCQSVKAECKANCLNKPDYRYWILQSVSPHIQKKKKKPKQTKHPDSLRQFDSAAAVDRFRVRLSTCVASLLNGTQTGAAGFLGLVPSFIRILFESTSIKCCAHTRTHITFWGGSSTHDEGRHRLQEAQWIVWEPLCWRVKLSLWHDDLAVWGPLR